MEYREELNQEDSWEAFEAALEDAVEGYVEGLVDHLVEDYRDSDVDLKPVDSDQELIDILGLDSYSISVSELDEGLRAYEISLPETDSPLRLEVERSVAQNNFADDEDREVVAYNMVSRVDEELKFENILSEFQRITRPDAVEDTASLYFREGKDAPLEKISSWQDFDENDVMDKAVEMYQESFGADLEFDYELLADSGRGWRIYEFDFGDVDKPLHLEMTMQDYGFSLNWKQDEKGLRYRNFVEYGLASAIDEVTD